MTSKNSCLVESQSHSLKCLFYSVFGLGDWDSQYKVAWKSMGFYPDFVVISNKKDAKLGNKLLLVEHVIYFIPTDNEDEAHYICAVLNSSLIRENLKILSSRSKSGLSGSIVSKIQLDGFDPKNPSHRRLVRFSKIAHRLAEKDSKVVRKLRS